MIMTDGVTGLVGVWVGGGKLSHIFKSAVSNKPEMLDFVWFNALSSDRPNFGKVKPSGSLIRIPSRSLEVEGCISHARFPGRA